MKVSQKNKDNLYAAIRGPIVDARIKLKLSPKDDVILAQVESEIWLRIRAVINAKVSP